MKIAVDSATVVVPAYGTRHVGKVKWGKYNEKVVLDLWLPYKFS